MFLRYEDMVREPVATFHKICDFLEVDFEQDMLDSKNFSSRYRDNNAHSKLYAPISTNNIGVYKKELVPSLLFSYEQQAQETLKVFGYPSEQKKWIDVFKR